MSAIKAHSFPVFLLLKSMIEDESGKLLKENEQVSFFC